MESWLSGLRRTTGNRVWGDTSPRVRIPNSPRKDIGNDILFVFIDFLLYETDYEKDVFHGKIC